MSRPRRPVVGLFVTCAVDLLRPAVGFAAARLLEDAGCDVVVPPQSCCGQVAYNNGLPDDTRELARQVIDAFADVDYIVVPSGSCAGMLKHHYPRLFPSGDTTVVRFAERVYELTCFLDEVLPPPPATTADGDTSGAVAYHDSCAGLREMGIKAQPRRLLQRGGHQVSEIADAESCCGFGGTFCVKFNDISDKMVSEKAGNIAALQPTMLLGGDVTCLINLAGKLQRLGHDDIEVRHVAEVLAGDLDTPAIGAAAPTANRRGDRR